ncbi:MAG TPA: hypothetical protein VLF61_02650 [Rhabdochlamydiaceae bacterium]|nr:hypothetical protein [Rhabdochlamydiaceae bacterium]
MRRIFTAVFAIHMVALLYFMISADMKKEKKHLRVKTVVAAPPMQEKKQVAHSSRPQRPAQKTAPAKQPPKKESKPTVIAKNSPVKKKQPIEEKKKQKVDPNVSHLLQELEETIAKIDQKRDKDIPLKQAEAPKWIKPLKIDAIREMSDDNSPDQEDFTYQDSLISCLRNSLDLPELGEVKIELTLNKEGMVLKLKVVSSESVKNRNYLEKNLQLIKFPPLNGKETRKTFILTFCNDV